MLRNPDTASVWNPKKARQQELVIRQTLHRFGYGRLPKLIRVVLLQAFPGETANWLTRDLSQLFYWAALAKAAKGLEWRSDQLGEAARYLELPISLVLNWGQDENH
jgi:hypothetical protein